MSLEKCPWCKEDIDYEALPSYQDEGAELVCDSCGKKFWVSVSLDYLISRDCKDIGVEHEWEQIGNTKCFSCKNCDELK